MLSIQQLHQRAVWRLRHRPGSLLAYLLPGVVVVAAFSAFALLAKELGSPALAVAHIATAPGCGAAEFAGLAHAARGQAGYYDYQDVDQDGVTCNSLADRFGSQELATRHLASARNCDAVRAQGLAPARRGMPGYYEKHDADGDGIACEPYAGR